MQSKAKTPDEYIRELPPDRQSIMTKIRKEIVNNLPKGFEETMSHGMIAYVVPHSLYPAGYHTDPRLPLPFISLASQKNFVAVYHLGLYSDTSLQSWFKKEYAKRVSTKLDMGKSCIRFQKPDQIPLSLMGELASKVSVDSWISLYESSREKRA